MPFRPQHALTCLFCQTSERCLGRIRRGPGVIIFYSLVWSRSIWWQGVWFCRLCLLEAPHPMARFPRYRKVSALKTSTAVWLNIFTELGCHDSVAMSTQLCRLLLRSITVDHPTWPPNYNYFYCTWADNEITNHIRFDMLTWQRPSKLAHSKAKP